MKTVLSTLAAAGVVVIGAVVVSEVAWRRAVRRQITAFWVARKAAQVR